MHSFTPSESYDLWLIWIMDDEYVAQILAKEAKESSIKYASQGMSAFMPSRLVSLIICGLHDYETDKHLQADKQCPKTQYPLPTKSHQSNRQP